MGVFFLPYTMFLSLIVHTWYLFNKSFNLPINGIAIVKRLWAHAGRWGQNSLWSFQKNGAEDRKVANVLIFHRPHA